MKSVIKSKSVCYILVFAIILFTALLLSGCDKNKVVDLQITSLPSKTTYFAGEYFEIYGLIITAEYADGSFDSIKFADNNDSQNSGYTYDKYKTPLKVDDTCVTFSYGGKTVSVEIDVIKKTLSAPNIENLKYTVTSNSITLGVISNAEYKINDGVFRDSNSFGGLSPNKEYTIYIRFKESDYNYASPEASIKITTLKTTQNAIPESQLKVDILSPTSLCVGYIDGAEYSVDGGKTYQDSNVFNNLVTGQKYQVCVRLKETETCYASPTTSVTIDLVFES